MEPKVGGPTHQDQKHTNGELRNYSEDNVILESSHVWEGDEHIIFHEKISDVVVVKFTHYAGHTEGSVAGLACKILGDGKKWVVAWSSPRVGDNKVYNDIVVGRINWDQIKKELDKRGGPSHESVKFGYRATIVVDDTKARSPTVTASIETWP